MSVRLRSGGNWYVVPNGNLRVRYGGNWQSANNCYVKIGGVGGGYWYDSGYRGYPATPSAPWVAAWDYNNVIYQWNAGGGGAPTSYYHVVVTNAGGGWIINTTTTATSVMFGVNWDTRYRMYVSAVSAAGLETGWGGSVGVGIGHPQQDSWGNVMRSRGWEGHFSGGANANEWMAAYVPAQGSNTVSLNAIHWRNLFTPMSSSVTPGSNRDVNWIFANADYGTIRNNLGNIPSHSDMDYAGGISGNVGNGTYWGIVPVGGGWSTTGNGTYMLWVDDLWLDGVETYPSYELVSSIPAQGNYYW